MTMPIWLNRFRLDPQSHNPSSAPRTASRVTIGVVVVFGVTLSTLLSLFVVPAFYLLLARFTRSPEAVARELETQAQDHPDTETA